MRSRGGRAQMESGVEVGRTSMRLAVHEVKSWIHLLVQFFQDGDDVFTYQQLISGGLG